MLRRYASLTHGLTIWTNMPTIMGTYPAGFFNGLFQCTLKPSPAITQPSAVALTKAWRAAKFDRPKALWVTNIAKYKFSDAHVSCL